jgi:hypothetical protein
MMMVLEKLMSYSNGDFCGLPEIFWIWVLQENLKGIITWVLKI